jgi:FixJ family two-component response regulator
VIERPARPFAAGEEPTVFVVDDDESMREALRSLFRSVKLRVETFGSTADFLRSKLADVASCLVLDVRLPGISGLDFQAELAKVNINIPIIFMTGHGDIPMSVKAMKAGAIDFLTKPFRDQDMLDAVASALERDRNRRKEEQRLTELRAHFGGIDRARTGSAGPRHCRADEQAGRRGTGAERDHRQDPSRSRHAKNGGPLAGRPGAHGGTAGRSADQGGERLAHEQFEPGHRGSERRITP